MKKSIFPEKLTHHARNALILASKYASERGQDSVLPIHVLYAIAAQKKSAGAHTLSALSLTPETLLPYVGKERHNVTTVRDPLISTQLKEVLVRAYKIASTTGYSYVSTEHIIHAILKTHDKTIKSIIKEGVKRTARHQPLSAKGDDGSDSDFSHITHFLNAMTHMSSENDAQDASLLEHFTNNLSLQKNVTPLIGRDDVLNHVITILSRKEKSNPLLVGAPGVGKTAIIEGLAQRIARGDVPAHLINTRILTLDLADLVAGTTYRGEFEARLKEIIAEASSDKSVILFIDELHMIVGAGNTQGSLDAANILKPALSRGAIRIIGATTPAEYKKHITKDAALARRFQVVSVPEPSRDETITILSGVREHYEKFHNVTISDDIITHIVDLSIRYLPSRHLPDKAFDILDEAAARLRVHAPQSAAQKKLLLLENAYNAVNEQKKYAIASESYDTALKLRQKETSLRTDIEKQKKILTRENVPQEMTFSAVAQAISILSKIPIHKITTNQTCSVQKALTRWQKHIVGQRDAVESITRTLVRSFAGLAPHTRPIGSFLFLGPTGVGKTFAATTLATTLFDKSTALIRVDMSELAEKHTVSKLLGAPAGYVGHGEGGTLTEQIRTNPYSVVLFDEIEKAHPDILNILLQILEEGTITDAAGERADFRNAIVILTSNIGTETLTQSARIGFTHKKTSSTTSPFASFAETKEHVLKELRTTIKPEILNRLDDIIVFAPLGRKELTTIARREINTLKEKLASLDVHFTLAPSALSFIVQHAGTHISTGARGIRRAIHIHLEDPIAQLLLSQPQRPLSLHADYISGEISIRAKDTKKSARKKKSA